MRSHGYDWNFLTYPTVTPFWQVDGVGASTSPMASSSTYTIAKTDGHENHVH